jgi:hypothetical protein
MLCNRQTLNIFLLSKIGILNLQGCKTAINNVNLIFEILVNMISFNIILPMMIDIVKLPEITTEQLFKNDYKTLLYENKERIINIINNFKVSKSNIDVYVRILNGLYECTIDISNETKADKKRRIDAKTTEYKGELKSMSDEQQEDYVKKVITSHQPKEDIRYENALKIYNSIKKNKEDAKPLINNDVKPYYIFILGLYLVIKPQYKSNFILYINKLNTYFSIETKYDNEKLTKMIEILMTR